MVETMIGNEFRKVMTGKCPDKNLLVPLFRWFSGYESNIEMCNLISTVFTKVDKNILNHTLILNNKLNHFIKFPKIPKDEPKLKFFYLDLAKYYGWTVNELVKNMNVVDMEAMKEEIAKHFAYDNKERKLLKLKCLKIKKIRKSKTGEKKSMKRIEKGKQKGLMVF